MTGAPATATLVGMMMTVVVMVTVLGESDNDDGGDSDDGGRGARHGYLELSGILD